MKLSIFRKEIFLKEIKSVLAANEVMGEKRYSGEEGMVFKVDLKNTSSKKKKYFLRSCLSGFFIPCFKKKRLNSRLRHWIKGCWSSVNFVL